MHPHRRLRRARQGGRLGLQRAQQLRNGCLGSAVGCVLRGDWEGKLSQEVGGLQSVALRLGARQRSCSNLQAAPCSSPEQAGCTPWPLPPQGAPPKGAPTCGVGAPSEPAPSKLKMWPPPGWAAMCLMAAWVARSEPRRLVRTTWWGRRGTRSGLPYVWHTPAEEQLTAALMYRPHTARMMDGRHTGGWEGCPCGGSPVQCSLPAGPPAAAHVWASAWSTREIGMMSV